MNHRRIRPSTPGRPTRNRTSTTTCARRWWPATPSTCADRSARTSTPRESVAIGDVEAQAEKAMANIAMLLDECGSSLERHGEGRGVPHRHPLPRARLRVMGRWLKGVYPVSTGLVVSALARPEWLVEIDVTAVSVGVG